MLLPDGGPGEVCEGYPEAAAGQHPHPHHPRLAARGGHGPLRPRRAVPLAVPGPALRPRLPHHSHAQHARGLHGEGGEAHREGHTEYHEAQRGDQKIVMI